MRSFAELVSKNPVSAALVRKVRDLRKTPAGEACLVALVLVVLLFPDVIFFGASLRNTDQLESGFHGLSAAFSPYPHAHHRMWFQSYTDNGGAVFQQEPMIEFMRYCLRHRESPYWNPFSAGGALGPETLVDQKFSIFTLANALLSARSVVYNATLLFLYGLGVFFVHRLARERLKLSFLAGVAMSVFFLLNGYFTANVGSNTNLSYLVAPACLFFSLAFLDGPTVARFLGTTLAFAALLSCSFMPTTIVTFLAIYAVLFGYSLSKAREEGRIPSRQASLLAVHTVGVCLAAGLLSLLYLPLLENVRSAGTLEMYAKRVFYPVHWTGILSMFSPSHFYEIYNAMDADGWLYQENVVFHMGLVALGLAGAALSARERIRTPLVAGCAAIIGLALARIFAVPGLSALISRVPVIGSIGCQYWWGVVPLPLMILVGFGVDNLRSNEAAVWPSLSILGIGIVSFFAVWHGFGLRQPQLGFKRGSLLMLAALFSAFVVALDSCRKAGDGRRRTIAIAVVALMFLELSGDTKWMRMRTFELFSRPPAEIGFLRQNIGVARTLAFGWVGTRPELGSAFQIAEITSNNLVLPAYDAYLKKAITLAPPQGLSTFPTLTAVQDKPETNKIDWQVMDILGAKYVLAPSSYVLYKAEFLKQGFLPVFTTDRTVVYQNPHALPRAFSVEYEAPTDSGDVELPPTFRSSLRPVQISAYHNAKVELKGNADKRMLVVLTDNWQKNWTATVNGVPQTIVQVNGLFRGVWVPLGDYTIEMRYRPRTLTAALILTMAISLALLLLFAFKKKIDPLFAGLMRA